MRVDERLQLAGLTGLGIASALIATQAPTAGRALIGIFGFAVFLLVAMANRRNALVLILVFLVLLGFVRRLLIPFAGWADNDPLLLVSPAAAITLWYLGRGQRVARGFLPGAVAVLLLWCIAQVLNPFEPGLSLAVQSLLFYVTPLAWFFVGRTFERETHDLVIRVVQWMAVPVVLLGLYHSFGNFFPFELTWVGVSGQSEAIFLPGFNIRPFSTLTSPQEYGYYLGFTLLILWARIIHEPARRRLLGAAMLVVTATLFLQATRSIFFFFLVALAVTALVHYRSPITLLCIVGIGVALASYVISTPRTGNETPAEEKEKSSIQALIDHELSGLTDPSSSTGPLHLDLVTQGLEQGIREPLGQGVSHGSIARFKNAPGLTISSESDIGNVAAGLGFVPGLTLLGIIIAGFALATRMAIQQPSARHLAILGIAVVAFGQWSTGALYCTSTILWFLLGGLDREWNGVIQPSRPRTPLPAAPFATN